jgi:hypothetical protein
VDENGRDDEVLAFRPMKRWIVLARVFVSAGCGSGQRSSSVPPQDVVLRTSDLPGGYQYGDDTACGVIYGTEGDWLKLSPLFSSERPHACDVELEWVWNGKPPYSNGITSSAYRFADPKGARRAFAARNELANWTASLTPKTEKRLELGDEAALLRGRGLNNPASGVVWRDGNIVSALIVEPADDDAALELARKQEEHLDHPSRTLVPPGENDPELELDDPTLKLPVYWLGRTFDPPGALPPLELELANVGGNGPGQGVQLWYGFTAGGKSGTVSVDTWKPDDWKRFRRMLLGRLVWDSPCAHEKVVRVLGGRAEIFAGYGTPRPVPRPCPKRPPDGVLAHVYLKRVVLAIDVPYCYGCAREGPGPYNTITGIETVVRSLRRR